MRASSFLHPRGTWCQLCPEATAEQGGMFCCLPVGACLLVVRGGNLGRWQDALRLKTRARGTEGAQDSWVRQEEVLQVGQRKLLYVNGTLLVTLLIVLTKS